MIETSVPSSWISIGKFIPLAKRGLIFIPILFATLKDLLGEAKANPKELPLNSMLQRMFPNTLRRLLCPLLNLPFILNIALLFLLLRIATSNDIPTFLNLDGVARLMV
jgi:hypothetical protein